LLLQHCSGSCHRKGDRRLQYEINLSSKIEGCHLLLLNHYTVCYIKQNIYFELPMTIGNFYKEFRFMKAQYLKKMIVALLSSITLI